ncbi:hypothetical protein LINPERPRIM_LOCUS6654 [Linum perenne]
MKEQRVRNNYCSLFEHVSKLHICFAGKRYYLRKRWREWKWF